MMIEFARPLERSGATATVAPLARSIFESAEQNRYSERLVAGLERLKRSDDREA